MSCELDDPKNHFLQDNSQKKTYAEVTQTPCMQELRYGADVGPVDGQPFPETDTDDQIGMADTHPSAEDEPTEEDCEITVTTEMKRKMAGPWQISIILKLIGRQLGYRALQTRLAGIWHFTGKMHLIDIGYGFVIMRFDVLTDYQHALMDGPWFVGDQYLHI